MPLSTLENQLYFNAFNLVGQIGSVRFRKLLNFFPDLQTAWTASAAELARAGLEDRVVEQIMAKKLSIDPETELARLKKSGIELLTIADQSYPEFLREIPNPPAMLYIRGEMVPRDELAMAVVGTRKVSPYGKQVTADLVADLVRANLTIVSGLALGTDYLAHRTAVETSGRTIAVLACGLDQVYPASNRMIAEQIADGRGALVSELPLGTPPLKHHFPNRNRIISGLSLGTLVIEAARDSGALITATHALEQNRQVFAIPGSIYNPVSEGPNQLIKMGAKPVMKSTDILDELNLSQKIDPLPEELQGETAEENLILQNLTREAVHFDQIVKLVGLPASALASSLMIMEMKGLVKNLGGNQYVRGK